MRSLAEPYYKNDRYILRDSYFLRFDAHILGFSEQELLDCAGILDRFLRERYDPSFLIGYTDRDGHSTRNRPLADVMREELNDGKDPLFCEAGISFQGFLRTDAIRKKTDLKKPWLLADQSSYIHSCAYTLDGRAYPLPRMPYMEIAAGHESAKQAYFRELAQFSQTDKRWLDAMPMWDVSGMITASIQTDADEKARSIGDVAITVSCYALDDLVSQAYREFRELAIRMDACLPFVHASVGFGDWDPEWPSYSLLSYPQTPPDGMTGYEYEKQYGALLGRFNLIPNVWDIRLPEKVPNTLLKSRTIHASAVYEMEGEISPYRTKEYLTVRKYLSPILVPMKKNAVYHMCRQPLIAPFTADEIDIWKHERTGELFPVFKES